MYYICKYIYKNKLIKHNLRFNAYNKNGWGGISRGGDILGGKCPGGGGDALIPHKTCVRFMFNKSIWYDHLHIHVYIFSATISLTLPNTWRNFGTLNMTDGPLNYFLNLKQKSTGATQALWNMSTQELLNVFINTSIYIYI